MERPGTSRATCSSEVMPALASWLPETAVILMGVVSEVDL